MNTLDAGSNVLTLLLARHARGRQARRAALVESDTGASIDHAALHDTVMRLAAGFAADGLGAGDTVLASALERIDLVAVLLATLERGAVVANVSALLGEADYAALLQRLRPRWIVHGPEVARFAAAADASGWQPAQPLAGTALLRAANPAHAASPADPASPAGGAFCLFTSGSTGEPKPVLHTGAHLIATNRRYAADVLGLQPDDVLFTSSRMSFAYGLNSLHFALYHGGTAVLAPQQPRPDVLCQAIARHRPTVFFGVPTVYRLMLQRQRDALASLTSVRLWVSAGEALPAALLEAWRDATGRDIVDGIGTTETLSTFISNRPGAVVPGSAGRPVRGFEVQLRDDTGRPAPAGSPGTLHVRGDTLPPGYWGDAAGASRAFDDGWFNTNDVFVRDAGGHYFHVGRANDIFKSGGNWVSPVRIESVLCRHPDVLECAVAPALEAGGLNRIQAFVVPRTVPADAASKEAMVRALVAHARASLAHHEYPHAVEFVAELPRNANGKLQRARLRP